MLWRIIRYGLGGSARNGGAQEAAAVADLLTRNVALETADIDRFFDMAAKKSALRSIRNFLFFPIFFTNAAMRLSLWFFSYAVLGPSMALLWRTRQYLADASAVQLTRNPDGLAGALQKLKGGVIPGGGWASHLFIVSPTPAERVTAGTQDAKQKQILAQAWAASAQHTSATAPQPRSGDSSAILSDVAATYRAAFAGDAQATARIRAFNRVVATFDPAAAARIPDPADLHAARQGDAEAIARLRALRHFGRSQLDTVKRTSQPSDTASISFLGFHPSLKRRLRRLQRMGAHVDLTTAKSKSWIVAFVFSLILAPLFLLLVSLFLLLIAVMTMTSLTFLVVWLAVIHKIFALVAHH